MAEALEETTFGRGESVIEQGEEMYVCVYVYTYVYIYIYTHICMHVYTYIYIYIERERYIDMCIYI